MPDLAFTRSFTRTPAGRTITLGCRYAAPVAEVWSAVTEPERPARWFGPVLESLPESSSVGLDVGGLPALVQAPRCDAVGTHGRPPGGDRSEVGALRAARRLARRRLRIGVGVVTDGARGRAGRGAAGRGGLPEHQEMAHEVWCEVYLRAD